MILIRSMMQLHTKFGHLMSNCSNVLTWTQIEQESGVLGSNRRQFSLGRKFELKVTCGKKKHIRTNKRRERRKVRYRINI
ncbi:Hypothetical predicted protein [Mytilus galloprovincialis]|uniref:Uncharacterized protein n=1 Tax=Mytilus galloprovincialis TaxID=29158 RepID=A0A8B6D193_MYTGA|nr:Hypothetical predicted protein [Mytilus galloprovincialis]